MSNNNNDQSVSQAAMTSDANLTDNTAILQQAENTTRPAVPLKSTRPLRSAKAAGLSSVLQIGDLLVFVTPGSHQAVVMAEKYDDYHNYLNREFETAPVKHKKRKSFVVTKPLFPAPPPVKHIKRNDEPEKKPSEDDDDILDENEAAKEAPAAEDPMDRPIAIIDDPRIYKNAQATVRQDLLGQKGALEKRYFGKEFPDDNIHIQLIYNILDIDKILAPFVNSIAETLNRMNRVVTKIDSPAEEPFEIDEAVEQINLENVKADMIGNFYLGNPIGVFLADDKETFRDKSGISPNQQDKLSKEWEKLQVQRAQLEAFVQYPRMSYFGSTFYSQAIRDLWLGKVNGKKPKKQKPLTEAEKQAKQQEINTLTAEMRKKLYYAIWLISLVRHSMAHSDAQRDVLFLLDSSEDDAVWTTFFNNFARHDTKTALIEAKAVLDEIYTGKLESINSTFLDNASKNLSILATALGEKISKKLVNEYYLFAEQKQHRNTGYSIKQLRELLIRTEIGPDSNKSKNVIQGAFNFNEQKLSSERSKLNTVLDFIIWRYYTADAPKDAKGIPTKSSNQELEFIRKLRGASLRKSNSKLGSVGDILFFDDEQDAKWRKENLSHYSGKDAQEAINAEMDSIIAKREIYREEAAAVWNSICGQVALAVENIQPKMLQNHENTVITELELKDDGAADHYFSKLMYLLTIFLDGKEINTLLTQLASQFDSIAGYWEILNDLLEKGLITEAEHPGFLPAYDLFKHSRQIAKELRKVNSIARMTKGDEVDAMRELFIDATQLLGWNGTNDSLEHFLDTRLDTSHLVQFKKLRETRDKNPGQVFYTSGYRNFIISNVIKNNRFRYMVRFGNPGELKKLAKNKALVEFVLKRLPAKQLKRYYDSYCPDQSTEDNAEMVRVLTKAIREFNAKMLAGVQTDKGVRGRLAAEREKNKILVSLYLTILYQIVKNLININSRYFLAFHLLERDAVIKGIKLQRTIQKVDRNNRPRNCSIKDYTTVTADALSHPVKTKSEKRFHRYLGQEPINDPTSNVIVSFRNNVEHLNIIRALCEYSNKITRVDSYFALYHFLMQQWLKDVCEDYSVFEQSYKEKPVSGVYCKDIVKTLCYPFGYSLARYKNLTVDGLFDMNERIPKAKAKQDPDDELPDVLYYQTTGDLPESGAIKPGIFFDRKENKYKRRKTTFYQKNTRITGTFIRLTEQPNGKPHKDGKIPTAYCVDTKKIEARKELKLKFFKGDDGGWYIKYIPRDCLTSV